MPEASQKIQNVKEGICAYSRSGGTMSRGESVALDSRVSPVPVQTIPSLPATVSFL